MKKVTIHEKEYEVIDEVAELMILISEERDRLRAILKEKEAASSGPFSEVLDGPMAEWISVETTKPVESGEYLVYWDGIKIRGDRVPGVACYQVAYWRGEMNKFVDPDGRKKWRTPDYWMKLPEPPKAV